MCVCVCVCVCACACACALAAGPSACVEVRGQFTEVRFLSFHRVGPRDETQDIRLGDKCLYLQSHLSDLQCPVCNRHISRCGSTQENCKFKVDWSTQKDPVSNTNTGREGVGCKGEGSLRPACQRQTKLTFSTVGSTRALFFLGGWGVSLVLPPSPFSGIFCLFFFVFTLTFFCCRPDVFLPGAAPLVFPSTYCSWLTF